MPICPKCRGENPELGAKCPRDGYYYIYEDALKDVAKDDWIGKLAADKYVILSLISEGGMGAVYRAMQLPVQREVAFKVLRAELQDSDQGHDRFAREARAVSKLTHPNIITMHDFGVDSSGHPFMVMEYAPGMSLADWIMQPGLKLDRITHVFRQILSALSEAHNQGIVHRDLKPENLIVTHTGADQDYIKLLDFGIARMVHDGATRGLTREGEVFGTPHYMAPEQAQGKKDIGPQADVYALGIMLYELLVGQCPFDAPTPLSILYMHINDDLPELEPRGGVIVPAAIREVIDRATAKQASERYADAGEMLAAFDMAIGNTTGKYVAPASTSSESITATQNMGAKSYLKKATAETLPPQRMTDSSNAVPVHDPQQDQDQQDRDQQNQDQQKKNTTFEMDAFQPAGAKKALVIAAALVILAGIGGAALLLGGDSSTVEANQQKTVSSDGTEADEDKGAGEDKGVGEAGDQDEPAAEGIAADGDEEPAEEQPAQELDDSALAAEQPDSQQPDSQEPTGDTPKTARAEETNTPPASSTKSNSDTPRSAQLTGKAAASAPPADKSVAAAPKDTQTGVATTGKSSAEQPASADEPKKFQPKKFQPKTNSDDEPEKFQPKKWR